jgi:hypothetical protein
VLTPPLTIAEEQLAKFDAVLRTVLESDVT